MKIKFVTLKYPENNMYPVLTKKDKDEIFYQIIKTLISL